MSKWNQVLKEKKLRATSQRLVILEALESLEQRDHHHHVTARDVYEAVQSTLPGLNVTTVYRTLEGLNQVGVVDLMVMSKDQVRFALRRSDTRHGHLVCRHCGEVETIDLSLFQGLSAEILSRYGFRLEEDHLTLAGHCRDCLEHSPEGSGKEPASGAGNASGSRSEHRRHG